LGGSFFVPIPHSVGGAQLAKNFDGKRVIPLLRVASDALNRARHGDVPGEIMSDAIEKKDRPVHLAARMAQGEQFSVLFREGMALVEATAAYLDGPGRTEAKSLTRPGALAYATESMRLTTRLMQLASWLLLQRAVNEGELTFDQAKTEKTKVKLSNWDASHEESIASLPKRLQGLIETSRNLHEQVMRLDQLVYSARAEEKIDAENPVEAQMGLLRAAFDTKR
jgi:regulator of CtrA degradation